MNVLIVYDTQFGTTRHLAETIGAALQDRHHVRVMLSREAQNIPPDEVDLLIVGSPTQMSGRRLMGRSYLSSLRLRDYAGVAAAAFDTRMGTASEHTSAAAERINDMLSDEGCRVVVPPEAFYTSGFRGLASGEEERAGHWARSVAEAVAVASVA